MMKLRELLNGLDILETNAELDSDIREVRYDSRLVESGDLFIAVTGAETDGHKYIPMAREKGAACVLCERRKQAVPGVGDRQARWMLVGEGPGAEEDQRGEPFVGQAGRLLDNMLAALGLDRTKDVYLANAVKCRPPHNRTPERVELAACLPYLDRQIALVQPRLLVALGRPAAQALLDRELAISAARGKRFERHGIPVVVTYHPAYLLRNPQDKARAWEDLCFARRLMAGEA